MKHVLNVPLINPNDESVILVRWLVADGVRVEVGAPLLDIETTKAVVSVEAEQAGWVRHAAKENTELPIGAPLAVIVTEEAELAEASAALLGAKPAQPAAPTPTTVAATVPAAVPTTENFSTDSAAAPQAQAGFTRLSPKAAALAAQLGLSAEMLAQAQLGLVTAAQLHDIAAAAVGGAANKDGASIQLDRHGAFRAPRDDKKFDDTAKPRADGPVLRSERPPMPKRAEIDALQTGAQGGLRSSLSVYFDSAALRGDEGGPSVLPLVLHETARLLASRPRFTAFFDAGQIYFYDAVRLGVAMDQGEGLRVVTVRDAEKLGPEDIAARLGELALDYIERRLKPEDVQDATFTVTDLSGFDVLHFEPLINGHQSAILALGGDSALPGHPMSLTLAFDHRVLTGREVAEFLQALRDALLAHAVEPVAVSDEAPETEAVPPAVACCDRCFIDVGTYYETFGKFALMLNYVRPDGSTGMICHSCREGT